MELNIVQVLILTVWSGAAMIDALSFGLGMNGIIQTGIFTGLLVGNPGLGLVVGATFQSFALGIGTYGGASIPNWTASAMIVTAFAGNLEEAGILVPLVGVPVSALLIQFDVLARMTNVAFQHRADAYVKVGNMKGIVLMNHLGILPWALSRALPIFFALLVGREVIGDLAVWMTENALWMANGFLIAGRALPAIGFSILLRYLPTARNVHWLIIGFVLAAFLGLPILAIALIGTAAAMLTFKARTEGVATASMGGDDYDE